ncbi:hypothetical protein ColLi_06952 [Colletotrichum liriopes]|uniref:Uncharacterized protein n=1 Tax=Colletotrichum liriopes TaxID=708192 RepID=A0AA37LTB1_9PEZI|nr:hypothetical protein ColLi_06952 [Colletotrichum liriopes]
MKGGGTEPTTEQQTVTIKVVSNGIVEDIGVLEYLISRAPDPTASIATIAYDWENIRKARCERIKAWARHNTDLFTSPFKNLKPGSGEWQVKSLKDTKPNMNAEFGSASFLKWAQGTDAITEFG